MLKKLEIVKVTRITEGNGSVSYYHDELFIGGYDNDGRFITPGQPNKGSSGSDLPVRPHGGGVVRPPPPDKVRERQEHEAEKEITSLQSRLKSARGES